MGIPVRIQRGHARHIRRQVAAPVAQPWVKRERGKLAASPATRPVSNWRERSRNRPIFSRALEKTHAPDVLEQHTFRRESLDRGAPAAQPDCGECPTTGRANDPRTCERRPPLVLIPSAGRHAKIHSIYGGQGIPLFFSLHRDLTASLLGNVLIFIGFFFIATKHLIFESINPAGFAVFTIWHMALFTGASVIFHRLGFNIAIRRGRA